MPTHDYIIANGTGAAVRADINLALSAIVSLNSSASEPATMYAYQLWADTAAGLLKIRNGANSAWVTLRQLDGDFSIVAVEDGLQATPSLTFTNDLNTGVFRSGADALAIVTGGQYAITCTSTQAVGIRTPNPSTALHVAGNARVGADDVTDAVLEIGAGASGNRTSYIDIVADTTYTDYGLRIIRNNTGANATSELKHRGTGALNFTTQEAAPIVFNTTNSPSMTILAGGNVGIGTTPSAWSSFTVLQVKNSSVASTGSDLNLMANAYYDGSNYRRIAASAVGRQYFNTDGSIAWFQSGSGSADSTVTFSTPMTLDSSGRLGIGTNASNANGGVLQLSGGITFPATPVAATDVNTLDDYEEGTWTPTQGAGLTVVGTFTSAGHYTKVGRQVTVQGYVQGSTTVAAAANAVLCAGLPFGVMNVAGSHFIGSASNANLTALTNVWLNQDTATAYSVTSMAATSGIYFTVSYFTA